MAEEIDRRVLAFRPKREEFHGSIRRIAFEDRHVYLSDHAKTRMDQRSITRVDVVRVLQRGHIEGEIVPGNSLGEWKCKVVANVKGSREIGVVSLIINDERILVKTVEWEDL